MALAAPQPCRTARSAGLSEGSRFGAPRLREQRHAPPTHFLARRGLRTGRNVYQLNWIFSRHRPRRFVTSNRCGYILIAVVKNFVRGAGPGWGSDIVDSTEAPKTNALQR